MRGRVYVVNNHCSKFKEEKKYGLVIIDEAHLFLNRNSRRFELLTSNIRAKKVVFLSATPVKKHYTDLRTYIEIAKYLLGKEVDDSWIQSLNTSDKQPEELISSNFDTKFPATRYFKDTVKSLQINRYEKTVARRYETKIWEYSSLESKKEVLLEKIQSLYRMSSDNRFVIFTRYVEKEAEELGNHFKSAGIVHSKKELPDKMTYYIVTGRNVQESSDFSTVTDLPTILILTYQIAEQGLNLPGYNHIINYHISAYPSALEQRYGRIDRLNSQSKAIFNCFLLGSNFDSNTVNFYFAAFTFLDSLLNYLPSRNTLLSSEILKTYVTMQHEAERYLKRLLGILNDQMISKIFDHLLLLKHQLDEGSPDSSSLFPSTDIADEDFKDLFEFCRDDINLDEELWENRDEAKKI